MKIIIAGAGEVGYHLARLLATESQDIVLIDTNKEKLEYAQNHLDVQTVRGDATSFKVIREAGIATADLLIAVTSMGDTNLTICIFGKKLGVKKTIARIRHMEYLMDKQVIDFKSIGIDELISPESLAAREIKRLLKETAVTDAFEFENGKLKFFGIQIDENAPVINKTLTETANLNPLISFMTVAIIRKGKTIIPHGETKFELGDHVFFIVQDGSLDDVLAFTGKKRMGVKNIMILGGSRTGVHAARRLGKYYNVKLIEIDKEKSFELADELPQVLIINGDGTSADLLEEEGIDQIDAFVAVTGNSETNILASLVAKNRGVAKTIVMVENVEYINLSKSIGLDTMINKKLIAANFISRYIRKGEVLSLTGIHGVDAEIMEFNVNENCKIVKKRIKDLNFPKDAIIGGVIRGNKGYITLGDFQIQPQDKVVVFSLNESIAKVEQFFK